MIYVSSRVHHAPMWRSLRETWPIYARWIDAADEADPNAELGENWATDLWIKNVEDAREAGAVVFYVEEGDFPLRGAYVEVGVALGLGIPVFVVLEGIGLAPRSDRPVGSWIRHPLVTICQDIGDAMARAAERA